MRDVVFVLVVVAFFALAAAYVRACAALVGPVATPEREPAEPATACARRCGVVVSADDVIGLVVAVALAAYLLVALLFPEEL